MNRLVRSLKSFGAFLVLFAGMTGAARAVDLSEAVILVASDRLVGSIYEQTVILAAPLPQGGHLGFIVNRPTHVKLETLFPQQPSTRNVADPVYAGGPVLSNAVFAVTRKAPDNNGSNGNFFSPIPGLVVVIDAATVDRIIETMSSAFGALVRSILHQQVSIYAGRAIVARLAVACGGAASCGETRANCTHTHTDATQRQTQAQTQTDKQTPISV